MIWAELLPIVFVIASFTDYLDVQSRVKETVLPPLASFGSTRGQAAGNISINGNLIYFAWAAIIILFGNLLLQVYESLRQMMGL